MDRNFFLNRLRFWPAVLFVFFLSLSRSVALQVPPDGGCFVYPTPASGDLAWVVYHQPGSGTAQISVYNEAGDLVAREQAVNGAGTQQTPLDLTHYRRGVYICRVVLDLDSGGKFVLQFFKFIVVK